MDWEILYYSDEVQEMIGAWPVGIRAYYARITERMCAFGPNLGMPFTDSLGQGLFEIARGQGRHRARVILYAGGTQNPHPTRLHQEITEDTGKGTGSRPQTPGRGTKTG